MRSWPSYGELTRQRVDDMEPAGDADPRGKRDPRDFALWKGWKKESEPQTASWPSPWGPGRPGWHIECSAMAGKYLGPAFDIHGGGVDLRFPHHENEQAQSRAAGRPFASYWLHNAWITTAGEKMSKSLGNSMLIPSVLERVRGIELRYYIVAAHYRSHVEFSFEALEESAKALPAASRTSSTAPLPSSARGSPRCPTPSAQAMDDDLGTPAAVAVIHDSVREGNRLLADGPSDELSQKFGEVVAMLDVLGLNPADAAWATGRSDDRLTEVVDALVQGLLDERTAAREAKDWARADAIRDRIKAAGFEIEDTPTGPRWTMSWGACRTMAGNSQRKGAIKKTGKGNPTAGSGGRVRRGPRGQGPDAQGQGPALPPGAQGGEARRARQVHAAQAAYDRRGRVGRRSQLGRRAAAGRRAGHRGLRRRGHRARRPDARGVQARRRAGR